MNTYIPPLSVSTDELRMHSLLMDDLGIYRNYTVNCPVCNSLVFKYQLDLSCIQKYRNSTCENGHSFTLDIGGRRCRILKVK
mgnify:CR=1 FL=1